VLAGGQERLPGKRNLTPSSPDRSGNVYACETSPIALLSAALTGTYGGSMEREYDLFEQFPNGDVLWRMTVIGHESAIQQLRELAATVMNRASKESPSPPSLGA
jgi:hypothetical protein